MKWTDEQLQAINESGKNIIVSAGAGSGKTAVLTERVITKLKQGIKINELLILTFTNLAAHEMKERIKKALIKNNDKENLDLIDSSYITTFDSFAFSIVKKYHYLLNLTPSIKIVDSSIIKLKQIEYIDQIFEELYKNGNKQFLKVIDDFCIKDDVEIRNYILTINQKLDMKINKTDYLNNYIDNYYNDSNINNQINEFQSIIYEKLTFISNNLNEMSYLDCNDYYQKIADLLSNLLNCKDYDSIMSNLNIKLPQCPKNRDDIKQYKENISNTLKEIKALCEYESEEYLTKSLLSTKEYIEPIIDIILKLDEKTKQYKNENEEYEFNDVALHAINLFKENEEIRKETLNNFNEILIDEYQDTNDIQETFISLISNNNVYMVGDIKQSIYRFRNANPYLFKSKYETYKSEIKGKKIDLNKNFRSRNEVLNNINFIFEQIMDNDIGGADYKDNHAMVFGNKSYIDNNLKNDLEIYTYEEENYSKEETEIFIIAADIKNKIENHYQVCDKQFNLRNVNYNDFTILVDRTTSFDLYKSIFEYLEIPLELVKDETISDDVIVTVIKNILNLILKVKNNEFDVSFKYYYMSIARSFLCEYNDSQIFDNIEKITNDELLNKINSLIHFEDKTIVNLIDDIIHIFDIYESLIKIGNIDLRINILDYLKELANNFSLSGKTVYDYIEYLNKMDKENFDIKYKSSMTSSNSVKIMSIHKSKGLEFPICYYSMLYKRFNISDLKEKFMMDNKYGIISPYYDLGIGETITKKLAKEQYIKEEISERIRLFYVALTRAKEKMIIISPKIEEKNKQKINFRSFYDILCYMDLNKYIKEIDLDKICMTHNYKYKKEKNLIVSKPITDFQVNEIDIKQEKLNKKTYSKTTNTLLTKEEIKNIEFGKHIHYLLEMIDFKKPIFTNIEPFYKDIITKFLNNNLLKNINNAKIYKEYQFIYNDDKEYHGIIDLMLEYENHIDIIDYKLKNVEDENYIKQLEGYKVYIQQKTNKKVNLYLYSLLDNKLKEIK